jgi:hypothetical protein
VIPRIEWVERVNAFLGGYFWLPCPLCGVHFGGHEESASWYQGHGAGVGVCMGCKDEADRLSQIAISNDPPPIMFCVPSPCHPSMQPTEQYWLRDEGKG